MSRRSRSFAERLRAALDHRPEPAIDRSRENHPDDEPRSRFAQQLHDALNYERQHALDHDRGEGIEI
jgi:hypothetical protein